MSIEANTKPAAEFLAGYSAAVLARAGVMHL
jgi:hypothetical protein